LCVLRAPLNEEELKVNGEEIINSGVASILEVEIQRGICYYINNMLY
jgi:hypothetical protein